MTSSIATYTQALRRAVPHRRVGCVTRVTSLALEAAGPDARLGEVCRIAPGRQSPAGAPRLLVGVEPGKASIEPLANRR